MLEPLEEEIEDRLGLLGVAALSKVAPSHLCPASPVLLPRVHSAFPPLNLQDEGY